MIPDIWYMILSGYLTDLKDIINMIRIDSTTKYVFDCVPRIHTIDLSEKGLTDDILRFISKIKVDNLDLSYCTGLTGDNLPYLKNCRNLNLCGSQNGLILGDLKILSHLRKINICEWSYEGDIEQSNLVKCWDETDYWDRIKYFKDINSNSLSKLITHNTPFEMNEVYERTVEVEWERNDYGWVHNMNQNIANKRCDFQFTHLDCTGHRDFRYANGENHDDKIDQIELEIGGMRIERVFGETLRVLRHLYNIEDQSIIPIGTLCKGVHKMAHWHESRLRITWKDNIDVHGIEFEYDIYQLNTPPKYTQRVERIVIQLTKQEETIRCNSNIPKQIYAGYHLYYIMIRTNKPTDLTGIELRDNLGGLPDPTEHMTIFENFIIIPFTKSLELKDMKRYGVSKFDPYMDIFTIIKAKSDTNIGVYTLEGNGLRHANNMYWLTHNS